jgi:hypothetical protein
LALTSLTSGGRSVGIVRLRAQSTEFVLFFHHKLSLLQPELTLLSIASGFKIVLAHTIFDVLDNIVDENKK